MKEVVGRLSQIFWALIIGVGVLIYTYFMTKTSKNHLNIHHTVKIAVIPNIKTTYSSSLVISFMSGSVFIILISSSSSSLYLTSGLSFSICLSSSRIIYKLVPMLKLGDIFLL